MGKYWMTVRHYKPKSSWIRMEHVWRHTLRYGRIPLASWTVTDISPSMVADWRYIHDHKDDLIRVIIEGDRNMIQVNDLATSDPEATEEVQESAPVRRLKGE